MKLQKINDSTHFVFLLFISFFFIGSNLQSILSLYAVKFNTDLVTLTFKIVRELLLFFSITYIAITNCNLNHLILNALFLLLILVLSLKSGFLNIILGMHFFFPLLVFITPINKTKLQINKNSFNSLILFYLLIHIIFQLIHLFFGKGVYAYFLDLDINARNPGLMYYPAASAFLTLALFCLSYSINKRVQHLYLFCLSLFLCSSIMGLVTFLCAIIFLFNEFSKNQKISLFFYFVASFIFLHLARYSMTRLNYLNETGGGRAKIFKNSITQINFDIINNQFGKSTNGAAKYLNGETIDSLYPALLLNLGPILFLIFFAIFTYYCYFQRELITNKRSILILIIVALSSFGLIITEASFPFYIIFLAKLFSISSEESRHIMT